MSCNECGEKPKNNCGAFPKAVIEIDNPEKIVLIRKVLIPASMGDESTFPPTIGKYHNVLLEYEASGGIYLYSSDGVPTKLSSDVTELQAQLNALRVRVGEEEVARADADTTLSNRITSLDNSLATVAKTGSYNDLSDKPTIGNGTLTIKKNGSNVGTFTANATANTDVNIVVPTKTSDLSNDGSDGASQYIESNDLATVATSGSYNDLTNKPIIGNATLTIKRNDTNAGTFTANATTNKSINIAVPTKTSDLTNDGSDGTSTYVETRNLPTVGNATLTITENNTSVGTFTANATSNKTINITSPTKTSDLTNDGADGTSTYVESDELPTVDTMYSSSSNNAIANSTVTNSLDRNVMTNLAVDSTPSTTTVNLSNTKTNLAYPSSSTTSSISLPVASSTQAGVMNSATFDAVTSNTNNINAILNGAVAISNLPASPTQAQLTTAWENETGLTSLINRASVYDVTNNKVWTYYTNDQTWHAASNTSQVTVNTFTNSSEGTIKGSTNDGQVFAENDGTGSVNGWDTLTSAVSSNTSKLATIAQGAEVNVQANWTQTDTNADDYIKNKPANLVQDANYVHTDNNFTTTLKDKLNGISAGAEVNVQSDWSQTNTSADDYIKNKPANLVQDANYVHTDNNFTTTLKNKLDGIESGAEANVQADWSQTDTTADDYIKNKPTIPTVNNATLTIQKNGTNVQTFTANSSTNKTANITVPTAVSELTNDAGYATTTQLNNGLATKQDTLTAGDNIQINGNTISATDTTYTAGNAIDITNGEISADIHPADFFTAEDTVSDCGSSLSLDDTMASTLKSVELKGDTYQQYYSGKNFCNGVRVFSNNALRFYFGNQSQMPQTFTLSFICPTLATSPKTANILVYYNAGANTGVVASVDAVSGQRVSVTVSLSSAQWASLQSDSDGFIQLYSSGAWAGTTDDGYREPQIEAGSTATTYEPYVGGIPAPNPDYPQDIQVVTGEQTVEVTGKNKINGSYSEISQTVRCTAEASGNGFKITSTSSSGATYVTVPIPNITSLLGQTVTVSYSSSGSGVRIGFFYLNSSEAATGNISYTETTTLPDSLGGNAGIGVVFYTSNNSSATYNDIQLEIGSTATSYEPYHLQSYEINLGKNLFTTINYSGDVTITGSNSFEANVDTARTANMLFSPRLPAGTYTLSYDVSKNSTNTEGIRCGVYVVDGGGTSSLATVPQYDGHIEYTFTSTTEVDRLYFYIKYDMPSGSTASVSNIQVEAGASATSFAPYFTPIELCKIGDYQDYIYKSGDDWYVHKEVVEISPNGTEEWQTTGTQPSGQFYAYTTAFDSVVKTKVYSGLVSDNFTMWGGSPGWLTPGTVTNGAVFSNSDTGGTAALRIMFPSSVASSVATVKTWLASNLPVFYYPIATPTDTKITDATLVAQLEALAKAKSYNDQINIIVTTAGENLPATLCVEAYRKSLSGVIEAIDSACTCRKNLVVHLPNGMTTYTNNDAPIPIPEVVEALKRGQSVFLVDDALYESVYVVTAASMDDGIYSMRADQTGINPRGSDGHWHIGGGGDVWDSVTFINDATPLKYTPNIFSKTWATFTSSTPLLDQSRRTYYPASSDMTFNNTQENLSVAELWEKLASSEWSGNPVILEVPLQDISTRTTNLVDNGFIAENPCLTISVSLGPNNYFEHETSEYTITGWAAECTPITFRGKESYIAGIVRVVGDGNTTYSFVVSLTEVEAQFN